MYKRKGGGMSATAAAAAAIQWSTEEDDPEDVSGGGMEEIDLDLRPLSPRGGGGAAHSPTRLDGLVSTGGQREPGGIVFPRLLLRQHIPPSYSVASFLCFFG